MRLWNTLSERQARKAAWCAFLAVLIVSVPLGRVKPPGGYFALEFPALHISSAAGPGSWPAPVRENAFFGLGFDFLFLVLYPLWLSLACYVAALRRGLTNRLGAVAASASVWVWAATPLDAAENTGLYFWLSGHQYPWLGTAISLVAAAKWLGALGAAGVALLVTVGNLRTRRLK
jgi:hypothetical protein